MDFDDSDFTRLVKATREKFGVSIAQAHDMIFADKEIRRLVALRINRSQECRKQALSDIRRNGDKSRFVREGDRIRFRNP
ncbi:hypothetical protein SAMN05444678_10186 [Sphingomonas sp. YR710]|jgi:hypothetical protein|uniref:hypothetical protein n=1 Tax=Sphingomonas sp. YR710 TaxID=1882773 RepID=UPI0008916CB8|nr:hypothetical protein [Sphingomonas sp. YR710]SDC00242.1 hypothetical protein SAMN05444678_10186 [Sphingomonas sp. YR710]